MLLTFIFELEKLIFYLGICPSLANNPFRQQGYNPNANAKNRHIPGQISSQLDN